MRYGVICCILSSDYWHFLEFHWISMLEDMVYLMTAMALSSLSSFGGFICILFILALLTLYLI